MSWRAFALLFSVLFPLPFVQAMELPMQYRYEPSAEPMTTDQALKVDPELANPHRQRWVLDRRTSLDGFETVLLSQGRYGIRAKSLIAVAQGHIRSEGPWYRAIADFPCTQEPVSWFGTREGTRKAVDAAAKLWETELGVAKMKLEFLFGRIQEKTPELAQQVGVSLFRNWLRETDEGWRGRVQTRIRVAEWAEYLAFAGESCKGKKAPVAAGNLDVMLKSMLEPLPEPGKNKLLARVPARRWNGIYTIRANIRVGHKSLNGQFMIDTAARTSVLSPDWLKEQGVLPVEVEMSGAPFEKVRWGGSRWIPGDGVLARRVHVDGIEIGGYELPLREFLLHETSFFGQPEMVGSCCAGVLGTDLLKRVVMEIRPGQLSEVNLYSPQSFRPEDKYTWLETATTIFGEMASSCLLKSEKIERWGVIWNSADAVMLALHSKAREKKVTRDNWSLECGGESIGSAIRADDSNYPAERRNGIGADAGIHLLSRGAFILDLPHGRLWFDKSALQGTVPQNRTGLELMYVFRDGERALKVLSVVPGSQAAALRAKTGLKAGIWLTEVDGKPMEEMDEWEVHQRLSGVWGESVTLKWLESKKEVIATLKTR